MERRDFFFRLYFYSDSHLFSDVCAISWFYNIKQNQLFNESNVKFDNYVLHIFSNIFVTKHISIKSSTREWINFRKYSKPFFLKYVFCKYVRVKYVFCKYVRHYVIRPTIAWIFVAMIFRMYIFIHSRVLSKWWTVTSCRLFSVCMSINIFEDI